MTNLEYTQIPEKRHSRMMGSLWSATNCASNKQYLPVIDLFFCFPTSGRLLNGENLTMANVSITCDMELHQIKKPLKIVPEGISGHGYEYVPDHPSDLRDNETTRRIS